jgi:hypothetical protein
MKKRLRQLKPYRVLEVEAGDGTKWRVYFRDVADTRSVVDRDGDVITAENMIPFWDVPRCYACSSPLEPGQQLFCAGIGHGLSPLAWHLDCRPSDSELEALQAFLQMAGA